MEKKVAAQRVLRQLLASGHQAYFVGGYVRDALLGKRNDDIDIATSALPDEVGALFKHVVPTGIKHGTVTVIEHGQPFEVTTFRTEGTYADHRRPDRVHFVTDIVADLERRDFTINAMALDFEGRLIDPFAGRADLEQRIIRCVGDPRQRFQEDALRMMRCIRFAANYDFEIEATTWEALIEQRPLLRHVAMERIREELSNMIAGSHPQKGMALLAASELISYFKADVNIDHEAWSAVVGLNVGEHIASLHEWAGRFALLYICLPLAVEEVQQSLRKLTFSRQQIRAISAIVAFHHALCEQVEQSELERVERVWKETCLQSGGQVARQWLRIAAVLSGTAEDVLAVFGMSKQLLKMLNEHGRAWLEQMPVTELEQLAITGHDVAQIGGRPGAWIGAVLERLLRDVALQRVANERDVLLQLAEKVWKELNQDD